MYNVIAITGIAIGVIGAIFGLIPYLKKKNINVDGALNAIEKGLTISEPFISIGKTMPGLKKEASLIDWMEQKAKAGVKAAEQLYHAGDLKTDEDRFKFAQSTVLAALKEIKVEPTANQEKLIGDFIHEAVNDLGHVPASEADKDNKIQQIQQKLESTKQENEQLKQTLNTVQNTLNPVQSTPTQGTNNSESQPAQTQANVNNIVEPVKAN